MFVSHLLREVHALDETESQLCSTIRERHAQCLPKPLSFMVMLDETKEMPLDNDLLKDASPCGEFQAQPGENLKDERHESARVGYDVGFERALTDWLIKNRANWRKCRQPEIQPGTLPSS